MIIAPTDNLLFNVNLGYLDTGYDEITVPTGPSAGYIAGQTEFSQAPQETTTWVSSMTAGLMSGGSLTTRFDYSYVSQYWRQLTRRCVWPGTPATEAVYRRTTATRAATSVTSTHA